jgi:hypothetical protein
MRNLLRGRSTQPSPRWRLPLELWRSVLRRCDEGDAGVVHEEIDVTEPTSHLLGKSREVAPAPRRVRGLRAALIAIFVLGLAAASGTGIAAGNGVNAIGAAFTADTPWPTSVPRGIERPAVDAYGGLPLALGPNATLVALALPDFQLTVSPSSQTLQPGSSVSFAIGVGSVGGFSDPVELSVSGLPSGVSSEFSPNPATPPDTSFLKLTAASNAAVGTFSLTITGRGGGITHVASGSATVDFGLVPECEGKIHGVVTDAETGLPIAGATSSPPWTFTTDDTGSYVIDHVRLGENNSPVEVVVTAQKDDPLFADPGQYWHATKSGVVVCNQTTEIDLALVPVHPGFMSGTIVEGNPDPSDYSKVIPTSTPITGAQVYLFYPTTAPSTTGSDGRYNLSFHLGYNNEPLTSVILIAHRPDLPYRHGYWQGGITLGEIGPGQHVVQDVALVKQCTASISGHVSYGDTGLPAANVRVSGLGGAGDSASTQTDAQGAFSFPELLIGENNRPVRFLASAVAPGYKEALDVAPLAIGCGGNWDVTFVLQRSATANFGVVQGHVYDRETGAPIAFAAISIDGGGLCSISGSKCDATTDSQGFYRADPVPVSFDGSVTTVVYRIVASHEAPFSPPPGYYGDDGTVEITAGSTVAHDFHLLRQRHGRLTGVVRDAITQAPIAAIPFECAAGFGGVTDENGRYDTGQVLRLAYPNAPTAISCNFNLGGANGYWDKSFTATIRADETTQQDVDLLPICRGATISGKVVDATTQLPIQGASVNGGGVGATTDANGGYRLGNVTVGAGNTPLNVEVTAFAAGYYTQTKTVTVFCGGAIILDFGRQTQPGHIIVVKRTSPSGSTQSFDFTRNWSSSRFALKDGESFDSGPVTPGSGYSVSESLPLPSDWDQAGASCSDGSPVANIDVGPGETVTCTFRNQLQNHLQPGTIIVRKVTNPSPDPSGASFSFTAGGGLSPTSFSLNDGESRTFDNLVPQAGYSLVENTPAGWDSTRACSDGSPISNIDVGPGETVTCTFTNTKRGSARVIKTVGGRPPSGSESFCFELRSGASSTVSGTILESQCATAGNGGVINFATKLVPGTTYALCEFVMPGWMTTLGPPFYVVYNPSGDNSTVCTDFKVDPGQTRPFPIDNKPPPGGLARTIGFWKNWASCAGSKGKQRPVLDQTLAAADPAGIAIGTLTLHSSDCVKAVRLLDKSTVDTGKKMASDPAFGLGAQLLAAKLNIVAGAGGCPAAVSAINDGQTLLAATHFNGITHDKLSTAQATKANALATTLDRYNNNLLC